MDSRARLAAVWQQQPTYLQPQLAAWLQKPYQGQLLKLWPKLLQEALGGGGQQRGGSKGSKKGSKGSSRGKKRQAEGGAG